MAGSVIVVGSVNADLVVRVSRLPGPGETVTGGAFSRGPGGKGGNQAAAAARLGARTLLVGMVGDDDLGREARADLEASGVDCGHLGVGDGPTGVASIHVDRRGENAIAVASGANAGLDGRTVEAALGALGPDDVVLASLEVPEQAVRATARAAAGRGCRFVLNPAPARALGADVVARCDVLTPNEHEAGALGRAGVDGLLAAGARAVAVTLGADGVELHRPGLEPRRQPGFAVEAVDTTGAGDAFNGALAWALAGGRPLEQAIRLAAAAGALACRAVGARGALPTADEVFSLAGA